MILNNEITDLADQLYIIDDTLSDVAGMLEVLKDACEFHANSDYQILLNIALKKQYEALENLSNMYYIN